jgi:glutathione synthase/RimK-type ligase-like ATP-grasp enzyme
MRSRRRWKQEQEEEKVTMSRERASLLIDPEVVCCRQLGRRVESGSQWRTRVGRSVGRSVSQSVSRSVVQSSLPEV